MDINGLIGFGVNFPLYATETTVIESIEPFEIAMTSSNTSATATLSTTVDMTRSVAIQNNLRTNNTGEHYDQWEPRLAITDSGTKVTANINTAGDQTRTIRGVVIQFKAFAIRGLYQGAVTMTGTTSQTASPGFTPVIDANTICIFQGQTTNQDNQFIQVVKASVDYDFATNLVTASREANTGNVTAAYTLIEFNPGIISSKQEVLITIASSGSSATTPLAPLDLNRAVSFDGGWQSGGNFQSDWPAYYIKDANTAEAKRFATTATTVKCRLTIVEFYSRWIKRVQRGQTAFLYTEDTHDITVTSVSTSKAFTTYLGQYNENPFANVSFSLATVELQSATNVRLKRYESMSFGAAILQATVSWELAEFW